MNSLTLADMTIPIYNSEIAPPSKRGMISGLHAQFVGFGFAAANVGSSIFQNLCILKCLQKIVDRFWLQLCIWRLSVEISFGIS